MLDDRGDPVAGAIIHLFRSGSDPTADQGPASATVVTDAAGRFQVEPTGPGPDHVLVVASRRHVPVCRAGVYVFRSSPTDLGDIRLERGFTVRGCLRSESRKPLAGARLRLLGPSSARSIYLGLAAAGVGLKPDVVTDAGGTFILAGLTAADWDLQVASAGHRTTTVRGLPMKPDGGPIELTLLQGLSLEGVVQDAAGDPIPGARVTLEAVGDNAPLRPAPAVSDAGGRWLVPDLPEGGFILHVAAEGFVTARLEAATPAAAPVTVQLTRLAIVTGRVMAAGSKRPINRFTVTVFGDPADPGEPPRRTRRAFEEAEDGRFRLTEVAPGRCLVQVCAAGRAFRRSAPLNLEAGKQAPEITFSLEPADELSGMVVASDDRLPVGGARVVAERIEDGRSSGERAARVPSERPIAPPFTVAVRTDRDGLFTLPHLSIGRYRLSITADDFFPREAVRSAGGRDAVHLFSLERGGAVAGLVYGGREHPVPGAPVVLVHPKAGRERKMFADAGGRYRFRGLPMGRCWIQAILPVGAPVPSLLEVRLGHVSRLDLNSSLASALTGTVRRLEIGVADIRVIARLEREEEGIDSSVRQAWSDGDGNFRIDGLPPGPYRLTARTPAGVRVLSRSVEVIPRSRLNEDVSLPGGHVVGRIEAAVTRRPLAGVRVRLRREGVDPSRNERGGFEGVISDGKGRFEIPFVPAGRYRLEAQREGFVANRTDPFEVVGDAAVGPIRVRLPGGASLSGVVLDSRRGAARISAFFRLSAQEESRTEQGPALLRLARRGSFRLRGLRPGNYELRFFRPGYRSRTVGLEVKPGVNGPMQVVLE